MSLTLAIYYRYYAFRFSEGCKTCDQIPSAFRNDAELATRFFPLFGRVRNSRPDAFRFSEGCKTHDQMLSGFRKGAELVTKYFPLFGKGQNMRPD